MLYVFQVEEQVFLNQEMPSLLSLTVPFKNKILTRLGNMGCFKERYYQTEQYRKILFSITELLDLG